MSKAWPFSTGWMVHRSRPFVEKGPWGIDGGIGWMGHRYDGGMSRRSITGDSFFAWDGDVLVVNVLGKPGAARDAIGKPYGNQLKVNVAAAPVSGRATDHLVRFLATQFGVSASSIEVVFGRASVNKQLRIHSPTQLPPVFAAQPVHGSPTVGPAVFRKPLNSK